MAAHRISVDEWRTIWWAMHVACKTGLPPERIEKQLRAIRFPNLEIPQKANLFRKYLAGERCVSLSIKGDAGWSYVLAAESICLGSYAQFSYVFFNLLEELYYLDRPEFAQRRFLARIASEIRVGLRLFEGLSAVERADPKSLEPIRIKQLLLPYTHFSRLQRVRSYMQALPSRYWHPLFRVEQPSCRLVRRLRPLYEEDSVLGLPPSLDDLALVVAFFIEAIELDDWDRCSDARDLLRECLVALHTDVRLATSSQAIERLLVDKLLARELPSYDYIGMEMGRKISKALWPFQHLPSTFAEANIEMLETFDQAIETMPELIHSKALDREAQISFLAQLLKRGYSAIEN